MRLLSSLFAAALLGFCHHVAATKAVFAHFMLDNADGWSQSEWKAEMALAITANIDAFALNIAAGSATNALQIPGAFEAASAVGFELFFSFDYAGNGAWAKADVLSLLAEYASNGVYFHHNGAQPLVSTFEGPASAADWVEIKATTGCFFIPDWSSLGAAPALALENGVADGLFSWAAWSYAGDPMDTYTDASYLTDLGAAGKPFMMAASPWFYTNLPGYSKNWMWPAETMTLWADRWNEILFLQPDYVEIISWNDFGESHYIGTTRESPPFQTGMDKFDYVTGIHHDALRWPLGTWAQQYKNDVATITEESLVLTYLLHDITCDDGDTVINTATQEQVEYFPDSTLSDRYIGYMATLGSAATLSITVGGKAMAASWTHTPANGVGVYYGSVYLADGVSGAVSAVLTRSGSALISVTGDSIGGCTDDGYANFNLYTTGDFAAATISAKTTAVSDQVCTSGTGVTNFQEVCARACSMGYCPYGACLCTGIGLAPTLPDATGAVGYALSDSDYIGLCTYLYNYGYTYPLYCSTTEQTLSVPAVSPFLHDSCTAGTGRTEWEDYGVDDLCSFLCSYGYCPIRICLCTATGVLNPLDNVVIPDDVGSVILPDEDNMTLDNMCDFACTYGVCVCEQDEGADQPCDWSLTFTSIDQLSVYSQFYNQTCNEAYALQVLSDEMAAALVDYTDINEDYDTLFGYYVSYIEDLIVPNIEAFMAAGGTSYFECVWTTKAGVSTSAACPDKSVITDDNNQAADGVTVEFIPNNMTGFFDELNDQYGIAQDWVLLDTITVPTSCSTTTDPSSGCGSSGGVCKRASTVCTASMTWINWPTKADDIVVSNPKDIWTGSAGTLADLPDYIEATLMDVLLGNWEGSVLDPVQVVSLPVSLALQALDAMKQVKSIGSTEKELEASEKEELIGWIVTAVLALVPFVGEEFAAAAGLTDLARGIAIAGEAANTGYDIYSVVKTPSSAPMAILGMLAGIGGVAKAERNVDNMATMASLRRGMGDEVGEMGNIVKNRESYLQNIVKSCSA